MNKLELAKKFSAKADAFSAAWKQVNVRSDADKAFDNEVLAGSKKVFNEDAIGSLVMAGYSMEAVEGFLCGFMMGAYCGFVVNDGVEVKENA